MSIRTRMQMSVLVMACIVSLSPAECLAESTSDDLPNIVIFIIDDLGLIATPQFGATGISYRQQPVASYTQDSKSVTPNLDSFAQSAMRFTHCYATPSCAPSRAQLISGNYPFNTGITYPQWVPYVSPLPCPPPTNNNQLGHRNATQVTNAFANLIDSSYSTAFGGKWNLRWGFTTGSIWSAQQPGSQTLWASYQQAQVQHLNSCGFDYTYAFMGNTIDYYPPYFPVNPITNTTAPGNTSTNPTQTYFPQELNDFATDYVNQCLGDEETFLLHYCFGLVHDFGRLGQPPPNTDPTTYSELFVDRMQYVDTMFGNVLQLIDANQDVMDNTIVIVAGDNGLEQSGDLYASNITPSFITNPNSLTVEGEKLELTSWGSRVPLMIRWPNKIPSANNGTFNSTLMDFSDLYATLVEIGGGTIPATYVHNGNSFYDQLSQEYDPAQDVPGTNSWKWTGFDRIATYSQIQQEAFVADTDFRLQILPYADFALYSINDPTSANYPFDDVLITQPPAGGWNKASTNPNPTTAMERSFKALYDYYSKTLHSHLGRIVFSD